MCSRAGVLNSRVGVPMQPSASGGGARGYNRAAEWLRLVGETARATARRTVVSRARCSRGRETLDARARSLAGRSARRRRCRGCAGFRYRAAGGRWPRAWQRGAPLGRCPCGADRSRRMNARRVVNRDVSKAVVDVACALPRCQRGRRETLSFSVPVPNRPRQRRVERLEVVHPLRATGAVRASLGILASSTFPSSVSVITPSLSASAAAMLSNRTLDWGS